MAQPKGQKEEVLKHLNEFGQITSMDAINLYGITRLAHHIYLLRKEGNFISTYNKRFRNRYGNISKFAVYRLV